MLSRIELGRVWVGIPGPPWRLEDRGKGSLPLDPFSLAARKEAVLFVKGFSVEIALLFFCLAGWSCCCSAKCLLCLAVSVSTSVCWLGAALNASAASRHPAAELPVSGRETK